MMRGRGGGGAGGGEARRAATPHVDSHSQHSFSPLCLASGQRWGLVTAKLKILARIQVLNVFFLVHALQF